MPNDQLMNPYTVYNKLNISGLAQISPVLPWSRFMAGIGRPDAQQANVQVPSFFASLSDIAKRNTVDSFRAYLKWFLIHKTAGFMTQYVVCCAAFWYARLTPNSLFVDNSSMRTLRSSARSSMARRSCRSAGRCASIASTSRSVSCRATTTLSACSAAAPSRPLEP